jgi:hypothetical protein
VDIASERFSAYGDGEQAEYYSATHGSWLPAVVTVSRLCGLRAAAGCDVELRFDVAVGAGLQLRYDVELAMLRPQFQPGETVDIFSTSGNGSWLPATVIAVRAMTLGYQVQVGGMHEAIGQVPASSLRRRFIDQESVKVFQGPTRGWSQAVVVNPRKDVAPAEPPISPESPWT